MAAPNSKTKINPKSSGGITSAHLWNLGLFVPSNSIYTNDAKQKSSFDVALHSSLNKCTSLNAHMHVLCASPMPRLHYTQHQESVVIAPGQSSSSKAITGSLLQYELWQKCQTTNQPVLSFTNCQNLCREIPALQGRRRSSA